MTQMTATPATAPTAFLAEGDAPIFNVFQIIFLNLVGCYSLTCAALLLEVHWINAVLIGWLGGGVFALAIIAITLGLASLPSRRQARAMLADWAADARAEQAVIAERQDRQLWDEDLLQDRLDARSAMKQRRDDQV